MKKTLPKTLPIEKLRQKVEKAQATYIRLDRAAGNAYERYKQALAAFEKAQAIKEKSSQDS